MNFTIRRITLYWSEAVKQTGCANIKLTINDPHWEKIRKRKMIARSLEARACNVMVTRNTARYDTLTAWSPLTLRNMRHPRIVSKFIIRFHIYQINIGQLRIWWREEPRSDRNFSCVSFIHNGQRLDYNIFERSIYNVAYLLFTFSRILSLLESEYTWPSWLTNFQI